jgi:DNA-binding phage protein
MANGQRKTALVETFVIAIEVAMQRQGLSPTELSRRADVGRPYLYRVLNREQSPSLEWIEKVSSVLGLKVNLKITEKI